MVSKKGIAEDPNRARSGHPSQLNLRQFDIKLKSSLVDSTALELRPTIVCERTCASNADLGIIESIFSPAARPRTVR